MAGDMGPKSDNLTCGSECDAVVSSYNTILCQLMGSNCYDLKIEKLKTQC